MSEAWRKQYERDVLKSADENHIWINAFTLIRPTDETLLKLGLAVVAMLKDPANLHQSESGYLFSLDQKELVVRINQS